MNAIPIFVGIAFIIGGSYLLFLGTTGVVEPGCGVPTDTIDAHLLDPAYDGSEEAEVLQVTGHRHREEPR